MPTAENITPAMIEAAARVYAHREEFNESKWLKYADTAEAMLRAALTAASPALYYSEYRTGNCTMIEADTAEEAAVEAEDFARAYQTRVAFTRVATPEDIESFSGRVYKVGA